MAAEIFRIMPSKAFSPNLGPQLLNVLENINQSFAQLQLIRAAMIQQKDGSAGDATDWVTVSGVFGFVDGSGNLSSTVAMNAFAEVDSFVGTGAAALQQCAARFKQ